MEALQDVPLHERMRELLEAGRPGELPGLVGPCEPVEVAEAFYHFSHEEQVELLGHLEPPQLVGLLSLLNAPTLEALLEEIPDADLRPLIREMEPDDAVYVLSLLAAGRASALLDGLEPATRRRLTSLLTYAEETAGRIMDPDVVKVRAEQTVSQAVDTIRQYVERVELDDFFSIFVVNESGVLVGAVPTWKMLLAGPDERVKAIMIPDVLAVEANMDQEHVSQLVRDHDLVTIPVVDHNNRLVGRITVDDVVDVINEEHEEDLSFLVGTTSGDVVGYSVLRSIRDRSPWLLVALVGEYVSALIMRHNESLLVALPQLAFFVPMVMAMGGNSGVQSAVLTIRGLATGEITPWQFWRRLWRELGISVGIGVVMAGVLVVAGWGLTGNWRLGLSVGLATSAGIVTAALVGTTLPMLLKKMGLDPALSTGPFLTTFNDTVGILIYLLIAFLIFYW